jgi:thiamine biosynthesis lipoprotein
MTSAERPGLPPRARLLLPILLVVFVALSVYRLSRPRPASRPPAPPPPVAGPAGFPSVAPELQELGGEAMGTRYTVKLAPSRPFGAAEQQSVEAEITAVLKRVDEVTSTYRLDSEINQLARHRSPSLFRMSLDLEPLMRAAQEISQQSGGAFDVTVRPLVEAWGLGATGPRSGPPDARQLAELRSKVGYEKLQVGDHVITKRHADLAVDLSGIALGYAVDRLSETLTQLGYDSHWVEIGGQQRGSGHRIPGTPWQAVVGPRTVPLTGVSLATTAVLELPVPLPGVPPVAHLIDPRTGRPVQNQLVSVSVVHPRAMVADAWATALAVLGPIEGPKLALAQQLAALFLVRTEAGSLTPMATAEFEQVERGEYIFDAANAPPDFGPVPAHDPGDVAGGDVDGP